VNVAGVVRLVKYVLLFTVVIEAFFALILTLRLSQDISGAKSLWYGVFHAISAFNNAGFDLFGDFRSINDYVTDPFITFGIALPFIIGGLGFSVIGEIVERRKWRRFTLHTKLVILTTALLMVAGTIVFLGLEYRNVMNELPLSVKLQTAFFQSVTPRTAGFSTVDIGALLPTTLFFICILMFIGGSPGSTAGGVKTTTFALLGLSVSSLTSGHAEPVVFGRRLPLTQVFRAGTIVFIALSWISLAVLVLLIVEQHSFLALLFETFSAFGTVGLSTGVTPDLTPVGRIVIILTMFVGRLGPLTVAFALAQRRRAVFRYPEEQIMVG
jgi:trk system potassium uptake protein TrkH